MIWKLLKNEVDDNLNKVDYRFTVMKIANTGFNLVNRKDAIEITKNHLSKMDVYKNLYIED